MRAYGRVDANQTKLVKQLRQIPGCSVAATSSMSHGFPDLVVGYQGRTYCFEVKDPDKPPSARKLTTDEIVFRAAWRGHYAVVETIEDCLSQMMMCSASCPRAGRS